MNSVLLFVALGTLFAGYLNIPVAEGCQARLLLESANNNTYKLNPDVLKDISQLQGPIRVIAVVGNARVGKSTTLNLISRIWKGESKNSTIEEIFTTGDTHDAVTHNVWAHIIIRPQDEDGNILLLDVEGTDLGDDSITNRLSMFTAMMSSTLNVFAIHIMGNSDINFLYRIARLSELVFKDKNELQNFPKLRIVLRTTLDTPSDDYIRDEIFKSKNQKKIQENRGQIIQKYFPKDSIAVSYLPSVNDRELLKDFKKLRKSPDWNAFESLAKKLKNSAVKRSFKGIPIDGTALAQLAEEVVKAMNDDSWEDFGDVYAAIEKDICRRSYIKHIKPVLELSSKEIAEKMMETLDEFKKECVLESEIAAARKELKGTYKEKNKREDEERRRREEEERKQKEEEEKRKQKEEEEKRRQEESNYWETFKSYAKYGVPFLLWHAIPWALSDEELKANVTILPHSEYNNIGLRGVCWKWNKDAEETFGLTGEGCGVIAQEVKMLYPWAVTAGKDGYLRVRYDMLSEMINIVKRNKNESTLHDITQAPHANTFFRIP